MLCDRSGQAVHLKDMYFGQAAFLLCGGPSLTSHDLGKLTGRGVLTCAVNNAAVVFRSQLWVSVDDPGNFCDAIWRDPGILKFVPADHWQKRLIVRNDGGQLVASNETVADMPATFGYRRNEKFSADRWLQEDTFNWGNHGKLVDSEGNRGSRSVMYVAIKLLFHLGIRQLYLLGCDFRMELGKQNYAFDQDRSASSVRGNTSSYRILNSRLSQLKPYFDQEGYRIENCTPNSGLTVFPFRDYEEAIASTTKRIPSNIFTDGMYDRQKRERDAEKARAIRTPDAVNVPSKAEKFEFTTIVAVDQAHLVELRLVWPTWRTNRPEILENPLLIVCDASNSEVEWQKKLRFVDHPNKRLVLWDMPGIQQREKMLSSLVFVAAREVKTPWYLKLDTDTVATISGPWIRPEWFLPDEQGRVPAFVSHPWGYTKPANALELLDDWADGIPQLSHYPRLNIRGPFGATAVRSKRIISWCFFGRTNWTAEVASYATDRLPIPSQDTFLWYCAARRGDHFRRVGMKNCWRHVGRRSRLIRACRDALTTAARPPSQCSQGSNRSRGVTYLLTGGGHAARLIVSIASLRRHYDGPITLFTTRDDSHAIGARITADPRLQVEHRHLNEVANRKNTSYLTKVLIHTASPYEVTTFFDADTLIVGDIEPLADSAERAGLTVTHFAGWLTSGRKMRNRIERWRHLRQEIYSSYDYQELVNSALNSHPAINLGVFAFRRGFEGAEIWWQLAWAGRNLFICDELSLQILLPRLKHEVLDCRFNGTLQFSPNDDDVRVWHFHGDKHVRQGLPKALWLPHFFDCLDQNLGGLQECSTSGDRALTEYLAVNPRTDA